METVFTARHWQSGRTVKVGVANGSIADIAETDEAAELSIAPGLIDVQVNGIGGHDLNDRRITTETVREVVKQLHRGGVTRFCPTVVTGPKDRMLQGIRTIAAACAADPMVNRAVIGIHVEGPFISAEDGPRGAHNKDWVRDPDEAEFMEWYDAAGGKICKVTLALDY